MGLLDGQIAIITGAGTGIGREAALMFANEGASLVLAGRRIEPLNEVVQLIESDGGTAVARSIDLEDGDAAAALGTWTLDEFGRVDILVNNAGHSSHARSIRYVSAEEWQSVFRVNVEGDRTWQWDHHHNILVRRTHAGASRRRLLQRSESGFVQPDAWNQCRAKKQGNTCDHDFAGRSRHANP